MGEWEKEILLSRRRAGCAFSKWNVPNVKKKKKQNRGSVEVFKFTLFIAIRYSLS